MTEEKEDVKVTTQEELDTNILKHTIKKLRVDLAEAKTMAEKLVKEHKESTEKTKKESEKAIADVRENLESKIKDLQIIVKNIQEEKISSIAAIEDKSSGIISNLQAEIKSITDESTEKISSLEVELALLGEKKSDLENNLKELQDRYKNTVNEWERKYESLLSESEKQKNTIEEQHNEAIMLMKSDMEKKEKEAIDQVKANEVELEDKLKKIETEAKKQLEDQSGTHNTERRHLMEAVESLKADHAKLELHITELETKYVDATKEIEEWQDMFSARSYCNLTYIQEDANVFIKTTTAASIDAVAKATKMASEHASIAQKYAKNVMEVASENAVVMKEAASQAAAKASKIIEPHLTTGNEMYNKNLKPSVDKYYIPINEGYIRPVLQHINPALEQTQVLAREGLVRGQHTVTEGRSLVLRQLKTFCLGWESELAHSTAPKLMHNFIRDICRTPEESMNNFFALILIAVVFSYRRPLWRITNRIISLPFQICWYLSPVRLLNRAKK